MVTDFRHVIPRLQQRIEELGRAVVRDSQEITGWRMHRGDVDDGASPSLDDSGWAALESWDGTDAPSWFRARVTVPERFDGSPVSLSLKVGGYLHSLFNAEALAFVDGELVQGLDAYHHDIPVAERAEGGREYLVALYVFWKPDFKKTDWQPTSMRPHPDLDPGTEVQLIDRAAEAFYWDAATAYDVALSLPEDSVDRVRILGALDRAIVQVDFREPGSDAFYDSIPAAAQQLGPSCSNRPSARPRHGHRRRPDPHRPGMVLAPRRQPVQDRPLRGHRARPDGAVPRAHLHAEPGQGLRLLPPRLPRALRGRPPARRRGPLGGERRDVDRARLQHAVRRVPRPPAHLRPPLLRARVRRQRRRADRHGRLRLLVGAPPAPPALRAEALPHQQDVLEPVQPPAVRLLHMAGHRRQHGRRPPAHREVPRPRRLDDHLQRRPRRAHPRRDLGHVPAEGPADSVLFTYGYGDGGGGPTTQMLETGRRIRQLGAPVALEHGTVQGYSRGWSGGSNRGRTTSGPTSSTWSCTGAPTRPRGSSSAATARARSPSTTASSTPPWPTC